MEKETQDKILESFQQIKNLCSKADKDQKETTFAGIADLIISEAKKIKDISNSEKTAKEKFSVPDFSSFRFLLVEDNQVNIMVAEAFLKKTGVTVEISNNGLDAVEKIKASEASGNFYHIVFMDMQMPVMNGPEAIKAIRNMNSEYAKKLKIVAMTGTVLDAEITNIRKTDINGYITKPISANILYNVCSEILSEYRTITPVQNSVEKKQEENKQESKKNIEIPSPSSAAAYPDFSSKKVLVVDDNKLNVEILNLMLKKTGAYFEDAFDGEEALVKFLKSDEFFYDMILMDIQMPKMDGNQCAWRIRNSERKDAELPIIAISANAFQEDKDKSLNSGINFHMSKPVNMKALHEKMNELFMGNV
ncbi:MAG: response regulator [Treponema sp.]|nr:response regulator [Treponema sp.]